MAKAKKKVDSGRFITKAELQRPVRLLGDYNEEVAGLAVPQGWEVRADRPIAVEQPWVPLGQQMPEQPQEVQMPGRIEAQIEGMQTVTRRRPAVEEEPQDPMKWTINELVYRKNGMFEVLATDTIGHTIRYAYEPYFDAYVTPSTAVHRISRDLMKTFAEKGLNVIPAAAPNKADVTEEMYQLLSIIMQDKEMRTKFGSAWTTVRNQYDSQF